MLDKFSKTGTKLGKMLLQNDFSKLTFRASIRPLLSHDVRQRRISGRHQLSADGRHLIDGFPFGRPRLRGPINRPSIDIPPRKRRRTLFDESMDDLEESNLLVNANDDDESEDLDFEDNGRQMTVRAAFDNADAPGGDMGMDSSDDEAEYEPTEEEISQMAVELEELGDEAKEHTIPEVVQQDLQDEGGTKFTSKASTFIHSAFPTAPLAVCETILNQAEGDLGQAWDTLSKGFASEKSRSYVVRNPKYAKHTQISGQTVNPSKRKLSKTLEAAQESVEEGENDEYVEEVDDEEEALKRYYDEHGLAGGSISSGQPLTLKPKIVFDDALSDDLSHPDRAKPGLESVSHVKSVKFASPTSNDIEVSGMDIDDDEGESEDGDFEGKSDIDSRSSDDSSNSSLEDDSDSSSSDEENERVDPTLTKDALMTSDTSSSGSDSGSSDSSSDSEPEETSSKEPVSAQSNSAHETDTEISNQNRSANRPGTGLKSTKARNQRRRHANALDRYKKKGILPAGTTITELVQLDMRNIKTFAAAGKALANIRLQDKPNNQRAMAEQSARDTEFTARRQELLESLASGGIDINGIDSMDPVEASNVESNPIANSSSKNSASAKASSVHVPVRGLEDESIAVSPAFMPTQTPILTPSAGDTDPSEDNGGSARKRAKLDMGAGRRLLFGALGLKTPRSKADEEKVKNDLMKYAKPLRVSKDQGIELARAEDVDEDTDAWKQKIVLSAVECCHDGIHYSEPPFPFVQRWDPQQQGGYSYGRRGGKTKQIQRNRSEFYDDQPKKKQKRQHEKEDTSVVDDSYYDAYDEYSVDADGISGHQPDVVAATEAEIQDQLLKDRNEEIQDESNDDLPALPADMSTLPTLDISDVRPGAVIAFKQLIMSEATQWQPQMSAYRTAVVIQAPTDGPYELQLAKRDREYKERYYDEETGQRVYGKFDIPDEEDDEEPEDDGFLEADFTVFVDGRLVQSVDDALIVGHNATETTSPRPEDGSALENTTKSPTEVNMVEPMEKSFEGMEDHKMSTTGAANLAVDRIELIAKEISDEARQEYSQFISEGGSSSTAATPVARVQEGCEVLDASNHSPRILSSKADAPLSTTFNGPSSLTPKVEHRGRGNENDEAQSQAAISKSDYPVSSLHASQPTNNSQAHSHVTDNGRQPDPYYQENNTIQFHEDADSIALVNNDDGLSLSDLSSPSQDLPALGELAQAQSSVLVTGEPSASINERSLRPALSDTQEQAAESYDRAMEMLDDSDFEGFDGTDENKTSSVKVEHSNTDVDRTSETSKSRKDQSTSRSTDPSVIPSGSHQVDLISRDIVLGSANTSLSKVPKESKVTSAEASIIASQKPPSPAKRTRKHAVDSDNSESFLERNSSKTKRGKKAKRAW